MEGESPLLCVTSQASTKWWEDAPDVTDELTEKDPQISSESTKGRRRQDRGREEGKRNYGKGRDPLDFRTRKRL